MFITTICTYLITTISNADAFQCSGEAMLGDHQITLESIQCDEEHDMCVWHYDLGTFYIAEPDANRPVLFGIPHDILNPLEIYEEGLYFDSWPISIYYEPGVGANYCGSHGGEFNCESADLPSQTKDIAYGVDNYQMRVFAVYKYHNSLHIETYDTSNTQCIEMTWMESDGNILTTQILGPAPKDTSSAPPSYPSIVTPDSFAVNAYEEIELPNENMRFRITERGSDGCAIKVDAFVNGSWVPAALGDDDEKTYLFLGMPGQMCPESIATENPCYFYSGTNYYVIPCN
jgi:hypothetical protein